MQAADAVSCSAQRLPVRFKWLEANLLSSAEADVLRKLQTKTLMARLLHLELFFFHSPREGGLLSRVECLEAFVFGTETGREAAMAECLKVVATIDRIATKADAVAECTRWTEDDKEESPGVYCISRSAVIVTTDLKCRSGVAGTLSQGQEVEVMEIATLKGPQLVRGRIVEPHEGWISLVSYETGYRWADRRINNTKQSVTQSRHQSTDSKRDMMQIPLKRVRVDENSDEDSDSGEDLDPDYVEDLGFHDSPVKQNPPKRVRVMGFHKSPVNARPFLSNPNCMQDFYGSGEDDPQYTFYQVLAYPKLGMNLQIGRIYTQAELEERGRCSMPPPLGQRELQTWVCRRDIFFQKLKDGAFFCKVGAPPAFDMQMATKCLQPAF